MKQLYLILAMILLVITLAGCSTLEARYNAVSARERTEQAEAYTRAETARQATIATQAVQATAQVAQIEASNRLMAFLATMVTISQDNTILIAAGLLAVGLFAAAIVVTGRGR